MSTRSPYVGLRPFKTDESDIYAGRETQTDELLRRLDTTRFLAVIGRSGCGKSSLVRAGLIASLETGMMPSAGIRWRVAAMRPGGNPMLRLAQALLDERALGPERGSGDGALGFLTATLSRGPRGLVDALDETPMPPGYNLLLLVDQFEEIFRFAQADARQPAHEFVGLLLETVKVPDARVYVVIAMRSDYLGDAAIFTGLPEAINESIYLVPRLTREQRRAAIVDPARVFGGDVEPALVARLLNETALQPDDLPLLQHVLMRMWDMTRRRRDDAARDAAHAPLIEDPSSQSLGHVLRLEDYERAGTLKHALSMHADEVFNQLTREQQRIARAIFASLSERRGSRRYVRRPLPLRTLAEVGEIDVEQVAKVVDAFRQPDCSFLVPPLPETLDETSIVDISHEALIKSWRRLSTWVDEDAELAETLRELGPFARRWRRRRGAWWNVVGFWLSIGDLWRGANLRRALAWKRATNAAWARLRDGDYDETSRFVRASRRYQIGVRAVAVGLVAFIGARFVYPELADVYREARSSSLVLDMVNGNYSQQLSEYLTEAVFLDELRDSNAVVVTEQEIGRIDALWRSGEYDGAIAEMEHRPCSQRTDQIVQGSSFPNLVELFVTNQFGVIVCLSDRTSDYQQADEAWWWKPIDAGGIPQFGEAEYDESADAESVSIYVPILDPDDRRILGIAKAVFERTGERRGGDR